MRKETNAVVGVGVNGMQKEEVVNLRLRKGCRQPFVDSHSRQPGKLGLK